jgi:V/A-type H+-transporting ATPase subunit C
MNPRLLSAVIKTHSLLADLLSPRQLISLMKAESAETFIQLLSKTPYAQILMTSEINSIVLEKVFHQVFVNRIATLWNIVPTNIAQFIQTYYMKFEVFNLKRIIQGTFHETAPHQIEDALLCTTLPSSTFFHNLVNLQSLDEIISRIEKDRFSLPSQYIELSQQYGELWPLELALDQHYASAMRKAIQALPKAVRDFAINIAGVEIDVNTLLFAVSHKRILQKQARGIVVKNYFSAPFRFPLNRITEIIESDNSNTVINKLPKPYPQILAPVYQSKELQVLVKLRQYLYEEARRRRMLNDFKYNVIFSYLVFCEIEKYNLLGLALELTQHVARDDGLQYIVLPADMGS